MNTLNVLLAQTKVEATLLIIFLIVVAGIIGFVTAWLYTRFINQGEVKALKSKAQELKNQNVDLEAEINNLKKSLKEKNDELAKLTKEVSALKVLNAKATGDTHTIILKNARTEQKLNDQDDALILIASRKHMLDYDSFGTASESEKDDLKMISGIGPFIEQRLHAVDIYSFKQISRFTAKDIEKMNIAIEYFAGRIERDEWVAQAKELVHDEKMRLDALERIRARKTRIYFNRIGIANKEQSNDLTSISGIGGWIEEKLNALGIFTFQQIANFNDEDTEIVTEAIEYFPGRVERDEWIEQAKALVKAEGKKTDLLDRIKQKKSIIAYNRIGVAPKNYANNLTLIKGISIWVEEKLNVLDIYTFDQISKLTPEDIIPITEILDIAPMRIERDNWVEQAKELTIAKVTFPLQ